eukprot:574989-Rhodomonas_salina.1
MHSSHPVQGALRAAKSPVVFLCRGSEKASGWTGVTPVGVLSTDSIRPWSSSSSLIASLS